MGMTLPSLRVSVGTVWVSSGASALVFSSREGLWEAVPESIVKGWRCTWGISSSRKIYTRCIELQGGLRRGQHSVEGDMA